MDFVLYLRLITNLKYKTIESPLKRRFTEFGISVHSSAPLPPSVQPDIPIGRIVGDELAAKTGRRDIDHVDARRDFVRTFDKCNNNLRLHGFCFIFEIDY